MQFACYVLMHVWLIQVRQHDEEYFAYQRSAMEHMYMQDCLDFRYIVFLPPSVCTQTYWLSEAS